MALLSLYPSDPSERCAHRDQDGPSCAPDVPDLTPACRYLIGVMHCLSGLRGSFQSTALARIEELGGTTGPPVQNIGPYFTAMCTDGQGTQFGLMAETLQGEP